MNSNILVKKILILAANPKGTSPLRLHKEVREIKSALQRSQKRDQFLIELSSAVRPIDFRQAMLDVKPQIVHFSGHGAGDGGLEFEDEKGQVKFVDAEGLAGLFELFTKQVECVVLNACYSEIQAKAIAPHVNYVIGMSQEIGDRAAIAFSVGFYDALGAGRSVEFAYKFGCAAIRSEGIPENLTPKLLINEDLIPEPGIDYTRLRDLLAGGKWKQGDKETAELILKVANREEEGWLRNEDMEKFSCQDLGIIDDLWVEYSNGHFGFSVQQRIWQEVGGKVDEATEYLLEERLGWRVKSKWFPYDSNLVAYSDMTFSLNAPQGHLPGRLAGIAPLRFESFWGVRTAEGAIPWCLSRDFSLPSGWWFHWNGVFLFSRIETCKL